MAWRRETVISRWREVLQIGSKGMMDEHEVIDHYATH